MPKMKTHSGAKKRFKKTATGKVVRFHAYKSHILEKKTPKQKGNLRKSTIMHPSDAKRIERLIAHL